ncbi:MAG: hypothetical protein AABY00_04255 [Nanoarchaeota archaeon]
MTFKHLESGIPLGRMDNYLELSAKLSEPTKTVLAYTLDVAAYLNSIGLDRDYALFGGYSVLSHLMKEQGENIAALWRGSTDIDMAGNMKVMSAIRSGYDIKSCLPSPNLEDKATIKLTTNGGAECRIDFYSGEFANKFRAKETNVHFGIPVNVIDPLSIIESKLRTPKEELQHAGDIIGMLYVLERRGLTPAEIATHFAGISKTKELYVRLKIGKREFKNDRLSLFPTKSFSGDLERRLHKYRPIAH